MAGVLAWLFATVTAQGSAAEAAPVPWQPPTLSSDRFESHPALDPLTGDLYFVRSSPQFSGWRILVSRCVAGEWQAAELAQFSGDGVEADPYIMPDGRRVYFISSRADPPEKTSDDLDIWYADRGADGSWGPPVRMPAPINSPAAEWFPRPDGQGRLYFGSGRPGGHGQTDIYLAAQEEGGWSVANVGGSVSTDDDDYEFEPASDGRFAVLMSGGSLYRVERSGDGWGPRQPVATGADGFHVGPTLSPSGRTLLFSRRMAERSGELFRQSRGAPEAWPACAAHAQE